MKKLVVMICFLTGGCFCWDLFSKDSVVHFSVRDEEGKPVTNAVAHVATIIDWKPGSGFGKSTYKVYDGNVNTNGNVSVSFYTYDLHFDCWVSADGFYDSAQNNGDFKMKGDFILGKYIMNQLEFEKSFVFTLRRRLNPLPLYCSNHVYLKKISAPKILYGFDMMENDWVQPYGKGKEADFSIQFDYYGNCLTTNNWMRSFKILFTRPMDGAYQEKFNTSSTYKTVYHADTNRTFQSVIFRKSECVNGVMKFEGGLSEDSYFVLRTRSKLDKDGNIVAANYSKLLSIGLSVDHQSHFDYVFNPIANDMNLEEDHKTSWERNGSNSHWFRPCDLLK